MPWRKSIDGTINDLTKEKTGEGNQNCENINSADQIPNSRFWNLISSADIVGSNLIANNKKSLVI